MARFLTKVLGRGSLEEAVLGGGGGGDRRRRRRFASREDGLLGADIPEMLVVEHTDEVRRTRKRAGRTAGALRAY